MSTTYKSRPTGGKNRPPEFSWGGLILFVVFVGVIAGMLIYQTYFK